MTDSAIADTINRHAVKLICQQLDRNDLGMIPAEIRWQHSAMADTILGEMPETTDGDAAWLIGMMAARTPGIDFDGEPADCDWDNLFAHFRTEILSRRDPKSHLACEAEIPALDGVGSR